MPPVVWLVAAVYLVVISAIAVGVTVYDKKIAIKNGRIEEAAQAKQLSKKNSSPKTSSKKGSAKKTSGKNTAKKGSGSIKTSVKGSDKKTPTAIRRIPEKNLLIISALGGSIAMLITMRAIRHKTQHTKFMVGIPAIIIAQCVLIVALVILL